MRRALPLILAILLLPKAFRLADADENQLFSPDYFRRTWADFKELPQKPLSFTSQDRWIAGGILTATFSSFAVDGSVRDYFKTHRNTVSKKLSEYFTHFGDYRYELPLHLSAWALGNLLGYKPLIKSAADGAEASLLAAGLVTPLITRISGRALPDAGEPALRFRPFVPGRFSFPSGHTTETFAVATVLDLNFRETFGRWHSPILYGVAAATAASRVYDQKHYVSDVLLGAGIGWAIGHWVASKPRNLPRLAWDPVHSGISLAWRF